MAKTWAKKIFAAREEKKRLVLRTTESGTDFVKLLYLRVSAKSAVRTFLVANVLG
jgi:hypothetical protein